MDLNFLYNSFDPKAYKLDNLYNNLSSKDIIQNKSDFCLKIKEFSIYSKKTLLFLILYINHRI